MVAADDFFKSTDDVVEGAKQLSGIRYVEKIVNKHFSDCIERKRVRDALWDKAIPMDDRVGALREFSEGILPRVAFYSRQKANIFDMLKKGKSHFIVKEFLDTLEVTDCDILVFPVYKYSNWVCHALPENGRERKGSRIVIPGNAGISITIQTLQSFLMEFN